MFSPHNLIKFYLLKLYPLNALIAKCHVIGYKNKNNKNKTNHSRTAPRSFVCVSLFAILHPAFSFISIEIKYNRINSTIMSVMNDGDHENAISGVSHNPLEQFVLLAKATRGAACLELIRQVLEAPGVYVFGELLTIPGIVNVSSGL